MHCCFLVLCCFCHFSNPALVIATGNIKREATDAAVNAYKDHETVVDPNIDRQSEQQIAHILGQDLVLDQDPQFMFPPVPIAIQHPV